MAEEYSNFAIGRAKGFSQHNATNITYPCHPLFPLFIFLFYAGCKTPFTLVVVMVHSVNLGPTVIAVCTSMTVAAAVFLGLRLYCKITRGRRFWWDDHVLIAAWVRHSKTDSSHISAQSDKNTQN